MANSNKKASTNSNPLKVSEEVAPVKSIKKPAKVKLDEFIDVQSCIVGKLIWKSKKTGYKMTWDAYGDINPMQVSDLIEMRNDSKYMFIANWVVLLGDRAQDIMDYLQISQYYKDVLTPDDIDSILLGDPKDLGTALRTMKEATKEALVYKAREYVKDGTIDSSKTIKAIREATGVDISL